MGLVPVAALIALILGFYLVGFYSDVFGGSAGRFELFMLDFWLLLTVTVLNVNFLFNRDYYYRLSEDNYTKRLSFLVGLPIPPRVVVAGRAIYMALALAFSAPSFFLMPYLVGGDLRAEIRPTDYVWFVFIWIGYALFMMGFLLFMWNGFSFETELKWVFLGLPRRVSAGRYRLELRSRRRVGRSPDSAIQSPGSTRGRDSVSPRRRQSEPLDEISNEIAREKGARMSIASATDKRAEERNKDMSTFSEARWLAGQEIKHSWLSYPVTALLVLFFGYFAASTVDGFLTLDGFGEGGRSFQDRFNTWFTDYLFLSFGAFLTLNWMSREYLRVFSDDAFSERLIFSRSLPISAEALVLGRLMSMCPALLLNTPALLRAGVLDLRPQRIRVEFLMVRRGLGRLFFYRYGNFASSGVHDL